MQTGFPPVTVLVKTATQSLHTVDIYLVPQLMIIGSLTTDGNLWGSQSALNVIGVYIGQLCFNAASRYITADWNQDVAVNLVALFIFVLVAGAVLCYRVRQHAQVWAEALQCSNVTDVNVIRCRLSSLILLPLHTLLSVSPYERLQENCCCSHLGLAFCNEVVVKGNALPKCTVGQSPGVSPLLHAMHVIHDKSALQPCSLPSLQLMHHACNA